MNALEISDEPGVDVGIGHCHVEQNSFGSNQAELTQARLG
jgi:hypothetical protein